MLSSLSYSIQAAILCPLALSLSLPIALGKTFLQLKGTPPVEVTPIKEASKALGLQPSNGKRRSGSRSQSLTPVSEVDEPVSVQPSPAPSKIGRLDLPAVLGSELFDSPLFNLDAINRDKQEANRAAGPDKPTRPAQVRRVTWKDDDAEGEAAVATGTRERETSDTADGEGLAFICNLRMLDDSPATIASIDPPTVPHNSPVISTMPMPGAELDLEDVHLAMPGGTVLRWRRPQHASALRSQFGTLSTEGSPSVGPIRLSNLYRSFSDPELIEDVRLELETPPSHALRQTVSHPELGSSEPLPQLIFRARTPIDVDGLEVRALNERLVGSHQSQDPHSVHPAETTTLEMSEERAPSAEVDDEQRLSDADSVAVLVQSGVEIAISRPDTGDQKPDTYESLVLGSEIQKLSAALGEKRESPRTSPSGVDLATELGVATERRGQFARVEGLPFSEPAAGATPTGAPSPSGLFSGLPIFSAGAYELGRDQGPVVAEGVVSPFSLSAAEQDSLTSPSLLPSISLPPSKSHSPSPTSAASTYGSTVTGQDYQSALSEAAEEEVDDATAAGLEVDDSSDDGQPPFASVVRTTDNATAGPVSGDLLTPEASPEQLSGPFVPSLWHPSVGATSLSINRTSKSHSSPLPVDIYGAPLPSPPVSPEDLRSPVGRPPQSNRADSDWLPELEDNRSRQTTAERGRSPGYSPVRDRQPSVGSLEEVLRGQRKGLYSDRPVSDTSTSSVLAQAGSPRLPYFLPASNTSTAGLAPSPTPSMFSLPASVLVSDQSEALLPSTDFADLVSAPVEVDDGHGHKGGTGGSIDDKPGATKKAKKYAKKRAKKEAARESVQAGQPA